MALEKWNELLNAADDDLARVPAREEEKVRVKVMFPDGSMHEVESVSLAEYRDGGGTDRVLWLTVAR